MGGTTAQNNVSIGTGGILTLNGGGLTYVSTGNPLGSVINGGGTLSLGTATRTFTVNDSLNAGAVADLTIDSAIIGNVGVGLTKAGTGRLVMNGTKTVDVDDKKFARGPLALQYSAGTVKFKNVRIRTL